MPQNTEIDLYTGGTPNGHKVQILLEELELTYTTHKLDISKNVQKEDWFLKINPNGRIPAIVDKTSGTPKRIFEGASILLYLTAKYDKEHKVSFAYDTSEYWEEVEWLVWMQSGIGPMQGQANHFFRYAPERIEYATKRYITETKRLYQVLEDRLLEQENKGQGLWVVGGKYSIADIACFSWVNWAPWSGVDTKIFPAIERWIAAIEDRPATIRGLEMTEKEGKWDKVKKFGNAEEAAKQAKAASAWIIQNMEADAERHK